MVETTPERIADEVATFLCEFCMGPVNPTAADTMHSVKGWEEPRTQGGMNVLHLRQTTGRYAHSKCVDGVKPRRRR